MRILKHTLLSISLILWFSSFACCDDQTDSERIAELEAYQRAYIAIIVVLGTLLLLSLFLICCPCLMLFFHTFLFVVLFFFFVVRNVFSHSRERNSVTPSRISSNEKGLVELGEHLNSVEYFYLRSILRNLNLEKYLQTFLDDEINFESITLLNQEEIEDIFDENVFHRKNFIKFLKRCKKSLRKDSPSKEKIMKVLLSESEQIKIETISSVSGEHDGSENDGNLRRRGKRKKWGKKGKTSEKSKSEHGDNQSNSGSRGRGSKINTIDFSDLEPANSQQTDSIDLEKYVEENENKNKNKNTSGGNINNPSEEMFSSTSSESDSDEKDVKNSGSSGKLLDILTDEEDYDDDDDDQNQDAPFCCIPQKDEFNENLIVKRGKIINTGSYGRIETAYLDLGDEKLIRVAIKTIELKKKDSEKKVHKEVEIMKRLKHPNLLNCFGCYKEKNNKKVQNNNNNNNRKQPQFIHIVMEYCEKGDLYHLKSKLSLKEKVLVLSQIIEGMIYLHGSNIVHRDLKTQNIVLSHRGLAKICDFGESRGIFESGKRLVGTPEYIAPEVYKPSIAPIGFIKRYGDMASKLHDIYGFGIIVWEVVCEEQPFLKVRRECKNNQFELLRRIHTHTLRPSLSKIPVHPENEEDGTGNNKNKIYKLLKELMVRCWKVNPKDRIQSFSKIKRTYFTRDSLMGLI